MSKLPLAAGTHAPGAPHETFAGGVWIRPLPFFSLDSGSLRPSRRPAVEGEERRLSFDLLACRVKRGRGTGRDGHGDREHQLPRGGLAMGYRDDFYTAKNIIGYTGNLNDNPTVYFANADALDPTLDQVDGMDKIVWEYGHITQAHPRADNVGRERVFASYSYNIFNVQTQSGDHRAKESVYGRLGGLRPDNEGYSTFHTSRNTFERVTKGNHHILAQAIVRHQNIKRMYNESSCCCTLF
jgi:hypothetical protein